MAYGRCGGWVGQWLEVPGSPRATNAPMSDSLPSELRNNPWPSDKKDLEHLQTTLAEVDVAPWRPAEPPRLFGACFVSFQKDRSGPGAVGEPMWAAAVLATDRRVVATAVHEDRARARYESGFLAMREGLGLEAAIRALPNRPPVVIVDATGRDHPRRAGLAMHLGAVLDIPTVGVTQRTLVAAGRWPDDERFASSPLTLDGRIVGYWLRTRAGTRPVAVHAGWRTDPEVAMAVVRAAVHRARTPEPLRRARRAARLARAGLNPSPLD